MKKSILVADSGGTQTDWCFVDSLGKRHSFTTSSFHPSHWNESFFEEFLAFWQDKADMKKASLHFYGAGCLSESNQQRMKDYFLRWGFQDVHVSSDILAACHAALGDEKGNVAILGTGSVYCTYDGKAIQSLHGGLGYLLGDEGSGYYFGKMLISELLNNQLDEQLTKVLHQQLGSRGEILNKVYGTEGKAFIGSVSQLTDDLRAVYPEISDIHKSNINTFVQKTVFPNCDLDESVSFIGGYAFCNQGVLMEILQKNNIMFKKMLQNPINSLTDYIQKKTF